MQNFLEMSKSRARLFSHWHLGNRKPVRLRPVAVQAFGLWGTGMLGKMTVIEGPAQGNSWEFSDGGSILVGRGSEADWQLADPRISRKQCRIEVPGNQIVITDLGSSGGTLVDGKKIKQPTRVSQEVTIRIGDTAIRVEGDFAEASTLVTHPTPAIKGNQVKLTDMIGKTLHNYEVQEEVHAGKMGMIFKAYDTKKSRDIALKVLWPNLSRDGEQMQRFLRGMKAMFPVRHENIVRIYNAGITRTGEVLDCKLAWVAMEHVEGVSLTEVIRQIGISGMLDWKVGFRVALQIARALEEAYDHKIIHRNITPQNILYNSANKTAKLSDLMWAKALEGAQSADVTAAGQVVGDLAYLPLERLTGDKSQIDCRCDIYGLGATVYALLTGRSPFESNSLPELIVKIRSEEPPKPKSFQLSIADLFEGVVLKMLAKRPEDRYETPSAVVKDLERVGKFNGIVN